MDIDGLIADQGGLVTRAQLLASGRSRGAIDWAVLGGRLVPHGRGVYAVVPALDDDTTRLRAVALQRRATISHDTAALWHGLELGHDPTTQHVTVPRKRGGHPWPATITPHWADLRPGDTTLFEGVRVTSLSRTLIDLARTLDLQHAVVAADSALRKGLISRDELLRSAGRLRGRGRPRVLRVMELTCDRSGSVLESLLRVLLVLNGLAPPEVQYVFRPRDCGSYRADFAWPEHRLLVEADGFEFHAARAPFRLDRLRGNGITRERWWLLRFSWEDVVHRPEYVLACVRDMLGEPAVDLQPAGNRQHRRAA